MADGLNIIGRAIPRIDALERVTGKATYTGDVRLPGMLYARVLRSPHPHARIRRIDPSKALALAGVKAVLTHENCRLRWTSGDMRNKRYVFNNPVRFVGDPLAAVAAVDRHVAEQALALIAVEYEPLRFLLDLEEALKPGAVEIQPGGNISPDDKGRHEPDVYRRGHLETGFAASDRVFEDKYVSKHVSNAQLERRVSIAQWDGDKLTVWSSTAGISNCQEDLAEDLGVPPERIRVVCLYMGGSFGGKTMSQDYDLMAAALAKETGAPVKVEFTRRDDYIGVHGRWPNTLHYKVGVKHDGTLQAIEFRGYSAMGPYRKGTGNVVGWEVYRCPNVETQLYRVYTNMAVSGPYRAPSGPQGAFAIEGVMDDIAHDLKIDPLEFRLKNVSEKYRDEIPYSSSGLAECLRRGGEAFEWKKRWRPAAADPGPIKRGVGVAMGPFASPLGRSSAVLRLDSHGVLWVHVGVTDVGNGTKTAMGLVAAEAMGLPFEKVRVISGDTDRCPYSCGESGSRTVNFTGYAVLEAAKDLKRQLAESGAPKGDDVLIASATTDPPLKGVARYSFAVHFVELEVDTELGGVRILKYLALQDSGRVINRLTATSQVQGGVIMGIGMALHEELLYDRGTGVPVNPGYYGARVMTHQDAPEVEVLFVEPEDAYGPYGAKALGEPPIIPACAAIANAIFNATGRRIKELPITRARIIGAMA